MIGFQHPMVLGLVLPWWLVWLWFGRFQRRAVVWVEDHVALRFRRLITVHDRRSLGWHLRLLLVMGLALVGAAAGPVLVGEGEAEGTTGELLLVIDASASMLASDVAGPEGAGPKNRLELARDIALGIVERLDGYRFGLASFSGKAAFHLPLTPDRSLARSALEVLEAHTFYRNSGSSLADALDAALHYVDPERPGLQVLLIGDGELPFPQSYDAPLAALVEQRVPVHAAAIGTLAGEGRLIYLFRDVVAGKEPSERRVLREYTTRREDEHLEAIARTTGGSFAVAGGEGEIGPGDGSGVRGASDVAAELAAAIEARRAAGVPGRSEAVGRDVAHLPLGLFLLAFLADGLVIGRRRGPQPPSFGLAFLGSGRPPVRSRPAGGASALSLIVPLLLGALLMAARPADPVDDPELLAHQANEEGIGLDDDGNHGDARVHYERSIGIGVRPEIPTYNLARSLTLAGDFTEAHELYQRALELRPDLAEAHFNDGVTLFLWGRSARDPNDCDLARTRELWLAARGRFTGAAELAGSGSTLAEGARSNLRFVDAELDSVDRLIAEPPEHCRGEASESSSSGEGGGGSEGGGGETGGGESDGSGGDQGGGGEAGGEGGGGPRSLDGSEREAIAEALERLREQGREEGKFHRRTGPEQFPKEAWESPDDEIWW